MCRINAFGRDCIRLEWFDSVLRTQLRGYRTHCRAAEDQFSDKKMYVKAAEPSLPCVQRPLRPQAAVHRPGRAGAGTIETVFFFRDRLTTRFSVRRTGQEVLGNVPWGEGIALINIASLLSQPGV